jgi:peptidoglycan/LPS O-acetylase OafA/YrhL
MEEPYELCAMMLALVVAAVLLIAGWLYVGANPKTPPDEAAFRTPSASL